MKKAKEELGSWQWTFHKGKYLNSSYINLVIFTDSSHTDFWPTNIAKKASKSWQKFFYICQYSIITDINNVYVS